MTTVPDTIHTYDGVRLFVHHWPQVEKPLKGVALIVHGVGEHVLRYAHVANYLNKCGWAVVGYDLRGHGQSAGPQGVLKDDDCLLRDLASAIDMVRASYPRHPLVLVSHSLGGVIAARFTADLVEPAQQSVWSRPVDGLVMSSPALQISLSRFQSTAIGLLQRFAPDFAFKSGIKADQVCNNPETVRDYAKDPLVHGYMTARMLNFEIDAGKHARARAPGWKTPTLVMWAGQDSLVDVAGTAHFVAVAPNQVVKSRRFDSMAHEIFNEVDRDDVLGTMGAWLASVF